MRTGRPKKHSGTAAELLTVLADPTRLLILRALATGEMSTMEIARACDDEVVNVGFHLGKLKRAGLVTLKGVRKTARYHLVTGDGAKVTATALEMTHKTGMKVTLRLL